MLVIYHFRISCKRWPLQYSSINEIITACFSFKLKKLVMCYFTESYCLSNSGLETDSEDSNSFMQGMSVNQHSISGNQSFSEEEPMATRSILSPPPVRNTNDVVSMSFTADASHTQLTGCKDFNGTSFSVTSASDTGYQSQIASRCFMDDLSTIQEKDKGSNIKQDSHSPKARQSEWSPPSSSTPHKTHGTQDKARNSCQAALFYPL